MTELQFLESVISITSERNKQSLEYALIDTLSNHLYFDAAFLLSFPRSAKADQMEVVSYYIPQSMSHGPLKRPHINMPIDNCIQRCLQTCDVIKQRNGLTQLILYPVIIDEIAVSILMLYTREDIVNEDKLIRLFIQIYANFIGIINDNEYDKLTGLLNRKAFDEHVAELLDEAEQESSAIVVQNERRHISTQEHRWLGVLDIDHFKKVNDSYGHLYGDEVLVIFAEVMRKSFRGYDLLFRYGGEEFIVILSADNEESSITVFERFRKALEKQGIPQVGNATVSIGVSRLSPRIHPKNVLEQADQALYYSKENGRNRVSSYQQLLAEGIFSKREFDTEVEMF